MSDRITLDQLRTLRAVAEEGSFSAAARKLGHVQAAVSQSIARLEAELDLHLFDRSARTPRLTAAGEAIVTAASKLHADLADLEALAARLRLGEETRLSLVVDAMFPTEALVAFAHEFVAAHPRVELALRSDTPDAVADHVRQGHAELGIAGRDVDLTGLDQQTVTDVKMVSVAASAGATTAIHLHDHDATGWQVVDLVTQRALVVAGLGWAHVPEPLVRDDLAAGRLSLLPRDLWAAPSTRSLVLIRKKSRQLGPIASWAATNLTRLCKLHTT